MVWFKTGYWYIKHNGRYLYDGNKLLVRPDRPRDDDKTGKWGLWCNLTGDFTEFIIDNANTNHDTFADSSNPTRIATNGTDRTTWYVEQADNSKVRIRRFDIKKGNHYWTIPVLPVPGAAPVFLQEYAGGGATLWELEYIGYR